MNSCIKLYRDIMKSPLYRNAARFKLFVTLLLLAQCDDDSEGEVELKRGQLVTSLSRLCATTSLTPKQVRCALSALERDEYIEVQATNKYSIVTVCNYDSYQELPNNRN